MKVKQVLMINVGNYKSNRLKIMVDGTLIASETKGGKYLTGNIGWKNNICPNFI